MMSMQRRTPLSESDLDEHSWRKRASLALLLLVDGLALYLFYIAPYLAFCIPLILGIIYAKNSKQEAGVKFGSIEEWASVALFPPIVFVVLIGTAIVAFRLLAWLVTAKWPLITAQTVWGWSKQPSDMTTGFLGFDEITKWCVIDAPVELWLFVIIPTLW